MKLRYLEVSVGLFVLLGIAALFYLAIQVSNVAEYRDRDTYDVIAYFDHIGGLKVRAPVTVSGVRIGRVASIEYDPERFQARVILAIRSGHDYLPADTQASIFTAGLLGEQYIALDPGGDFEMLGDGDEVLFTQSALVLETMIGRVLTQISGN
ncbi:outer membrane lipid asymmetry maintenance protein MlaD [Thioalkalivibrio paradoxus]|uniref:Organic solvent ABC transporter substrate-binding protein n=1 Tax=Thioalkalivibrio paradoxus ARh 1 TaxID=713585 RepID=W0DPY8_9GAMM|nr:outer membrane lipid asymmetry maintenance protein MlaD [Thioalkalivibrio paradoxus]AHE99302.1 organic solvent ABC transporter substrate-binding protein [Thioalkalivibrio paradoxus ARh 1]